MTPPVPIRTAAVLVAAVLTACATGDGATPRPDPTPTRPATSDPTAASPTPAPTPGPTAGRTPSPSPPAAASPAPGWSPGPDEVLPGAKELAARVAEALTTYEEGGGPDAVGAVPTDPARRRAIEQVAAPLLDPELGSVGRVRYAQLGGFRDDHVSVMVVVEQRVGPRADGTTTTRTLDVRLRRDEDAAWHVDALASIGGEAVARPADLPPEAEAVLDDPRITLPDSARWDVHAGVAHPKLLRVMADIAERHPFTVVTISSGHPHHVFGTEHVSDHIRGRAVDIAILGERPIVEDREEGSATYELTQWLWRHPDVRQIGSPWALDGYGGRSFTDVVHQDHLHVAVADADQGG